MVHAHLRQRRVRAAVVALLLALALVALPAVTACGTSAAPALSPGPSRAPAVAPSPAATPTLTPAQLAGQRVISSYSGLTPPAKLLRRISHGQVAGVIFFKENIKGRSQIRSVIRTLAKANAATTNPVRAPLLLMTDQEGGMVRRLPGPPLLSAKDIGAAADPAGEAERAGRGAARNLAGVGMNVNLAPVLDVYRTAGNFIDQYERSYAKDPAVVATLGGGFIAAQQAGGVAATAKHFPGLGAASAKQNTDLGPVTLKVSRGTLRRVDELPYETAISAGVQLVMLSWAVYPALDARRPAGLSATIVQGELRKRLGFAGVTITDALEAGALRPFGSTSRRSLLAARAGTDLLLCSGRSVAEGEQARAALLQGYRDGTLKQAEFTAAAQRVIALREALAR